MDKRYHLLSGETIEDFLGVHSNDLYKLTKSENLSYEGDISLEELRWCLKNMKNKKSSGSNGFTGEFFKFFFPDIKQRLLNNINHTFEIGKLSPVQSLGITTLIPKGDKDKALLKNWRPLKMLNTDYKLISGILAERLKPHLDRLINCDQKGFLRGRYIGEVTRTAYDIIDYAKNNNVSGIILLADIGRRKLCRMDTNNPFLFLCFNKPCWKYIRPVSFRKGSKAGGSLLPIPLHIMYRNPSSQNSDKP